MKLLRSLLRRADVPAIFVHIPKTAGVSISKICRRHSIKIEALNRTHLPDWTETEAWSTHVKFAFVRNPWDRMVSCFAYFDKRLKQQGRTLAFGEFLDVAFADVPLRKVGKDFFAPETIDHAIRSCSASYFDPFYHLFDAQGKMAVDSIGRFESLQQDFASVCRRLQLPEGTALPHRNKSAHRHYARYYDAETRLRVARKYEKDIEFFGYTFEDTDSSRESARS